MADPQTNVILTNIATAITTLASKLGVLGPYATATVGQLPGTGTNDNANAGNIGEYLSATGTAVAITSASAANIATISLTAGDWDVWGQLAYNPGTATTISQIAVATNQTSAAFPGFNDISSVILLASFTSGVQQAIASGIKRYSESATTSVYLIADASFAGGTMTATGTIAARRAR
jgi:hypothetical protein